MKAWYCVTTSVDNRGRITAGITDVVEAEERPESRFTSTQRKDIYNDYFGSHEEAAAYVEEARRA